MAAVCYPDPGKFHLVYGNYFLNSDRGGAAKCVSYESYGSYTNFSTAAVFSFQDGSTRGQLTFDYAQASFTFRNKAIFVPYNDSAPREAFYAIYNDCTTCGISQHYYGDNGHGCTYWRHEDNMNKPAHCCDRIFDRYCGAVPKYQMYDASCESKVKRPHGG
ncbi:hypothetical protein MTO96_014752 [Rhipicephalus appendiculatus]